MKVDRRTALGSIASVITGCRIASATEPRPARILKRLEATPTHEGKGALVHRVFPSRNLRHLDPFVLLDDFDVSPPAGFPFHPHRGFEAFTYMLEGAFDHEDNLGNKSRVGAGGIQRFCSGAGAWHSEMPGTEQTNRGLQLWVNLPRRLKKMRPEYQAVPGEQIAESRWQGGACREVVTPNAAADLKTQVTYLDVTLGKNGRFELPVEPGHNTLLYAIQGSLSVQGSPVERHQALLLSAGGLSVESRSPARFLFLSGRPHGEPIIHRGPYVD